MFGDLILLVSFIGDEDFDIGGVYFLQCQIIVFFMCGNCKSDVFFG